MERKREGRYIVILIPRTPIGGGIYCHDQNAGTKPTIVSEATRVARSSWATVAPMDRAFAVSSR